MIKVIVENAEIKAENRETLAVGNVNSLPVDFVFSALWDGLNRVAVFTNGDRSISTAIVNDRCFIPWEVLTAEGKLYIALRGIGDEGKLVVCTENEFLGTVKPSSAAEAYTDAAEATPNVIDALISDVEELKASSGGAVTASVEPAEDDIPKVFFGGALQQTKDEAVVPFRYISKTQDISGYAKIKAQGNSSLSKPKKNQTVKLYKDAECTEKLKVDFKGWGKQNKFCFKANWIDLTHARNVVSARLWADIVKSRTNYAELPELLRTSPNQGAIDGFPIKVYANGVYQGRYTLNIPKDAWMANMDDKLDEHCILCGEGYQSGCFREVSTRQWSDEVHDIMPTAIADRWKAVISFVMNSTDDEFKTNLDNYIDVESAVDYYLFAMVSCGLDSMGKNQLYFTYDGQKWYASMYDMDSTWGLWWTGEKFVASDYARNQFQDYQDGEGNLLYERLETLFIDRIRNRYGTLRKDALSYANIVNRFERFTDICPSELVKEDYAVTTGSAMFTDIPSKGTNNIQQIRQYVTDRLAYVDDYINGLGKWKITYILSSCTVNNTQGYAPDGTAYYTTINPVENHEISSVVVTMGGVDVTSSCYADGVVSIASVTGDVVITAVAEEMADNTLVYELTEETILTGSNYIDTGVVLCDTLKDYTVVLDYAGSTDNVTGNNYYLIHCNDEKITGSGFALQSLSSTGAFKFSFYTYAIRDFGASANTADRTKIVMVCNSASDTFKLYCSANESGALNPKTVTEIKTLFIACDSTLHIGARLLSNGAYDNYMKGIIYGCKVYTRVLSDEEIANVFA